MILSTRGSHDPMPANLDAWAHRSTTACMARVGILDVVVVPRSPVKRQNKNKKQKKRVKTNGKGRGRGIAGK